jgi:hypothetical protein
METRITMDPLEFNQKFLNYLTDQGIAAHITDENQVAFSDRRGTARAAVDPHTPGKFKMVMNAIYMLTGEEERKVAVEIAEDITYTQRVAYLVVGDASVDAAAGFFCKDVDAFIAVAEEVIDSLFQAKLRFCGEMLTKDLHQKAPI